MDVVAFQMQLSRMFDYLRTLSEGEEGQGLVEYALIIALVSVALITALGLMTGAIGGVFSAIQKALEEA